MCDTPQVINAPNEHPSSDPAAAISAPCHKKIALISIRRYPMERKIAISLILASRFETLFQHNASSWQEREESTLQLFLTLRMSVAITVSLIILLAGFGIFNVLTMSVLAKIKEIAILRSMGYRRIDVSSIFLWQGALIAAAGSLLGCLLGALMTWGVSHIPIRLRGLLYTNYFLVTWDWRHYVFATLLAVLAVFIASYVPARRAAELPPVVTIRGSR